jgi:hypothetical protein
MPLHLQTWSALLQPERSILTAVPDNSHLPPGVTAAAAAVFTATMQAALEDAAKSAHEVRLSHLMPVAAHGIPVLEV